MVPRLPALPGAGVLGGRGSSRLRSVSPGHGQLRAAAPVSFAEHPPAPVTSSPSVTGRISAREGPSVRVLVWADATQFQEVKKCVRRDLPG